MKSFKYLLLAFTLQISHAYAYDFKGIEIGKTYTLEYLSSNYGLTCGKSLTIPNEYSCYGNTTIAGDPAKIMLFINSEYNAYLIAVRFKPDNYDNVKSAMIGKFGTPLTNVNAEVHNAMGASYAQNTSTWNDKISMMELTKYNNKVTESALTLTTIAHLNEIEKQLDKNKNDI